MSTTPIWVTHPQTRQQIDVAPLIELFDTLNDSNADISAEGARNLIRRTIRTLNLSTHDPAILSPPSLLDLYFDLYRLKDAFAAVQVASA